MGHVEAICIAASGFEPMQSVAEVEAMVGVGLSGDRYASHSGFYSDWPTDPGAREVTLIARETLDALRDEVGIELSVTEHRRNLTIRGVDLGALVGARFTVGEVVLEGVRDCPPCVHLEELTGRAVLRPLLNRGGLRARIVVGGTLRVGDTLSVPAQLAATT